MFRCSLQWILPAVLLAVAPDCCSAQSLLERLEKKLSEATLPAPNDKTPNTTEPKIPDSDARPGSLGLTADVKGGSVTIISVKAGGPADKAGLKPGDTIQSAGGVEVKALDDLSAAVAELPAGARVEVVVQRSGKSLTVPVTLGERVAAPPPLETLPPVASDPRVPALAPPEEIPVGPRLGVRAEPVTADAQRRYGLAIRRGAVIEGIEQGSPAERFGLPLGAAIVAVDGARVDTPDDLAALIAGYRPGDTVEISYYQRDAAFRKKVRLAPAAVVAPRVPAPVAGPDRPLLRGLERALESVAPPRNEVPGDSGVVAEIRALQERLAEMQARVEALEARIKELESAKPAAELEPLEP